MTVRMSLISSWSKLEVKVRWIALCKESLGEKYSKCHRGATFRQPSSQSGILWGDLLKYLSSSDPCATPNLLEGEHVGHVGHVGHCAHMLHWLYHTAVVGKIGGEFSRTAGLARNRISCFQYLEYATLWDVIFGHQGEVCAREQLECRSPRQLESI